MWLYKWIKRIKFSLFNNNINCWGWRWRWRRGLSSLAGVSAGGTTTSVSRCAVRRAPCFALKCFSLACQVLCGGEGCGGAFGGIWGHFAGKSREFRLTCKGMSVKIEGSGVPESSQNRPKSLREASWAPSWPQKCAQSDLGSPWETGKAIQKDI